MNMYDLIKKKRLGNELSSEEIDWIITGYLNDNIPPEQISAWLMAICFNGMSDDETVSLTMSMLQSGEIMDLSELDKMTVDKHSTGGVGDKVTLIAGPLAAACGAVVPKLSGRALGHTGGTIDKLESIPGLRTSLSQKEFIAVLKDCRFAVATHTANVAPADKKLYALRSLTGTVESIPLIASSIMSKKLATGADSLVLDVKTGSGAFLKTVDESQQLAGIMTQIAKAAQKNCMAIVTDMNAPLGMAVGNALEVEEACQILRGKRKPNHITQKLLDISLQIAEYMLHLSTSLPLEQCAEKVRNALVSGKGFDVLQRMVYLQGGNPNALEDANGLPIAPHIEEINSQKSGIITHIDSEAIGHVASFLGAGREGNVLNIDPSAGIILNYTTGDRINANDIIAQLHTSNNGLLQSATNMLLSAFTIE